VTPFVFRLVTFIKFHYESLAMHIVISFFSRKVAKEQSPQRKTVTLSNSEQKV
jgi:hypothetical protein